MTWPQFEGNSMALQLYGRHRKVYETRRLADSKSGQFE